MPEGVLWINGATFWEHAGSSIRLLHTKTKERGNHLSTASLSTTIPNTSFYDFLGMELARQRYKGFLESISLAGSFLNALTSPDFRRELSNCSPLADERQGTWRHSTSAFSSHQILTLNCCLVLNTMLGDEGEVTLLRMKLSATSTHRIIGLGQWFSLILPSRRHFSNVKTFFFYFYNGKMLWASTG